MNIILANPPWKLTQENVYSQTGAIYPPLGLASIAAVIRQTGRFQVTILDALGLGMGMEQFREELLRIRPTVLGLSAYTTTVVQALDAAAEAKKALPGIRVVLGGPHPSVRPEELITQDSVDFVVRGEGEITLPLLLDRIEEGSEDYDGIPGLTYKVAGEIRQNPGQSFVQDLDSLPWPSRDDLPMHIYRPSSGAYTRLPIASMITSRGCPFKCTFCSRTVFGNTVRFQSPAKVLDEIEYLIDRFGIKEIYFADDCFTLSRERTEEICELILERELDLTWICSTRVNLVDEKLLRKMKQAGCASIAYGIETADSEQLKNMKKGITLDNAKEIVTLTMKMGMEARTSYIFGLPGETMESLERTLALALEINSDFAIFNLATPRPGTELYNEAKEKGLLIADGFELYPLTDSAHCLIRLEGITPDELKSFYDRAYRTYYFRPSYIFSRLMKIRTWSDIRLHWRGLKEYASWRISEQK